ncbi:exosome complex component rrp46 [Anaeramoeba flamelloides]|uniref:Exosome complex component rrp46 n=1 Tax=Anaeramoeba flamelloides TaxID=1746091 RepID=A0AAV7YXF4_9EUKA|nr:exosome complex component rrp46 [Anaeramoeba flamelloides]KAJ6241574.1 exosome complex component rrp46 [Anaeramoeba flamelloides]
MTKRIDNRNPNQMRPLSSILGENENSDGSVIYSQGKTKVLVGVHGPKEVNTFKEQYDKATVSVVVKTEQRDDLRKEKTLEKDLKGILEYMIFTERSPRSEIIITAHILNDDGSLFSTLVNACVLALCDAGIEIRSLVYSITFLITENKILIDPIENEIAKISNHSRISLVLSKENEDSIVFSKCIGLTSLEIYDKCLEIGNVAKLSIRKFMKQSLKKNQNK